MKYIDIKRDLTGKIVENNVDTVKGFLQGFAIQIKKKNLQMI